MWFGVLQNLYMLFKFLTYLQPAHYFSLRKTDGDTVFPIFEHLPEAVKQQLQEDGRLAPESRKPA